MLAPTQTLIGHKLKWLNEKVRREREKTTKVSIDSSTKDDQKFLSAEW